MAIKKNKKAKRKKTKTPVKVDNVNVATKKKQSQFIELFFKSSNNISQTCEAIGIYRCTYYLWMKTDPEFKSLIENKIEQLKDYMETMIVRAAADDWRAAYAWLKVKAKDRGWKPDIALAAESVTQEEELVIRHVYDKIPKKVKRIESKEIENEQK